MELKISWANDFFFLIFLQNFVLADEPSKKLEYSKNDYAFITNQQSNKLDVINLRDLKKVAEIDIGNSPAGIEIDQENKMIFISNPKGNNVSVFDIKQNNIFFLESGESPLGITLSSNKQKLYVSNWYNNTLTVINIKLNKIENVVKVGESPAGIDVDNESGHIIVANRGSNSVSILNEKNYKIVKEIFVEKAPFGVFFDSDKKNIFISNVQSNSISVINSNTLKLVKNIKVGKWPYQVAFDKKNDRIFVTNQRGNSITIIESNTLKVIRTISDFCEYPEGIDINYNKSIIVVACWFDDEVAIFDLLDYSLIKKIPVSGGPRAFGSFILQN